ncbi:transketolase [Schaalia hyovaginalis]|uniref:transketolase n=1 Tax=Schaalia hyovaginalis TaxID=29316 RepID=UPI0012B34205|nr:transketolase [Schaalia hyovaginalis]MDY4492878.1 transketolase [Schaalia hyovaginalis]MST64660.1 transketolase [Schaalia hyovaginalis]
MVRSVTTEELKERAKQLRMTSVQMIYEAQSGHPGGSLSAADVVANLYFREMRYDPTDPKWEDRDRFVLSKGHVAPVLYSALAIAGFVPMETIHTLRKKGSAFQGHPDSKKCPGIEISTGSLGQGISAAVGMAIGLKRDGKDSRVYTLLGDGETQEGQVWEAVQCARTYELDAFTVIIDENNLQIDGHCDEVSPNFDFVKKFEAFDYDAIRIDGHDMDAISKAFDAFRGMKNGKPKALILKTIKGRGVSYMEDVAGWHGAAPNDEQYAQAMAELEKGLDR